LDAVVSMFALCTVPDPAWTLSEVLRILRPGGKFVSMEHVAAPAGTALRLLQRVSRSYWLRLADGFLPDADCGLLTRRLCGVLNPRPVDQSSRGRRSDSVKSEVLRFRDQPHRSATSAYAQCPETTVETGAQGCARVFGIASRRFKMDSIGAVGPAAITAVMITAHRGDDHASDFGWGVTHRRRRPATTQSPGRSLAVRPHGRFPRSSSLRPSAQLRVLLFWIMVLLTAYRVIAQQHHPISFFPIDDLHGFLMAEYLQSTTTQAFHLCARRETMIRCPSRDWWSRWCIQWCFDTRTTTFCARMAPCSACSGCDVAMST